MDENKESNYQKLIRFENEIKNHSDSIHDISSVLAILQESINEKQFDLDTAVLKKSVVLAEERFLLLREEQIKAIRQLQENQRNTTEFYETQITALEEKITDIIEQLRQTNAEALNSMLKPVDEAIQKVVSEFKLDMNLLRTSINDIDTAGKQVFLSVIENFSNSKQDFEKTIEQTKQKTLHVFNRLFLKRNIIDSMVIITSIMGFISFCFALYFVLYR